MNPTSVPVILLAAVFTNNILLTNFLGMCSFLSCSTSYETAIGLGIAVTFVMTATTPLNFVVYHYLLVPLGIAHLQYIVFIAVIAAFVQLVEMIVDRFSPRLYVSLGVFLPLITVNCAILGVGLFMVIREYSFLQSLGYAFGSGAGWMLAIVLMAGLRKKMRYSRVPKSFSGAAIVMILTGIMAMAFMGFIGMVSL